MSETAPLVEQRSRNGAVFDVHLKNAIPPEMSGGRFPPLEPGSEVVDGIRIERDVAVPLRDGVTIYVDVYRPEGALDVPAIIAWSPYGKRTGYATPPMPTPGVPAGTLSPGTKFEGPDPEYWCRQGYAIINPDPRGCGNSEGVLQLWSQQEAGDIADVIEWIAVRDWCNGKVGMAGNSYLAASQWHAAAQRPPHLACIAPWEGTTDPYRQMFRIGGVKEIGFLAFFGAITVGVGQAEDIQANLDTHAFHDAYWQEKVPDLESIEVPAYICGGWSHHFHLRGAVDGFRRIGSKSKWLRIHREFEWPDFYTPENLADLNRFFERYLKGRRNGWEMTPPVRIDVMDRGDRDHANRRGEVAFPLPDTEYKKLYLDAANGALSSKASQSPASVSYDAESGTTAFDVRFDEDTELTGFFKLRLWVEARGSNDADIFVAIQKADADGAMIPTLVVGQPHPGAQGLLRASQRELDETLSTESEPVQKHASEQLLGPGEIVPLDIPIWPTSRFFRAGERLRVLVSGHYTRDRAWLEPLYWETRNKGEHVIHTGGAYDSHLLIPVIPKARAVIVGRSVTSDALVPLFG